MTKEWTCSFQSVSCSCHYNPSIGHFPSSDSHLQSSASSSSQNQPHHAPSEAAAAGPCILLGGLHPNFVGLLSKLFKATKQWVLLIMLFEPQFCGASPPLFQVLKSLFFCSQPQGWYLLKIYYLCVTSVFPFCFSVLQRLLYQFPTLHSLMVSILLTASGLIGYLIA